MDSERPGFNNTSVEDEGLFIPGLENGEKNLNFVEKGQGVAHVAITEEKPTESFREKMVITALESIKKLLPEYYKINKDTNLLIHQTNDFPTKNNLVQDLVAKEEEINSEIRSYISTVRTFLDTTKKYLKENPESPYKNIIESIIDNDGDSILNPKPKEIEKE